MTGNRKGMKGVGVASLVAVLAAIGLLVAPTNASAQFLPSPTGGDYCSDRSYPAGKFKALDPTSMLGIAISPGGAGLVTAKMYGTSASTEECISPNPAECTTNCTLTVETVCEFHCQHDHTAPYPWTVELVGTPLGTNSHLVGWSSGPTGCVPVKSAPRTSCIVRMKGDQTATAYFADTPDTGKPSAPLAAASPQTYAVDLTWGPSADPENRLAGYDVYRVSATERHETRVMAGTTSARVANIMCDTSYTFRVEAYDWSGNEVSSDPVTTKTGACPVGTPAATGPRPNTVIHVKPPKVTRKRTAYFHFGSGTVRATKYQCKLDKRTWARCSARNGKTYTRLARGYHTFRVRAGNANGWDPTPARYTWRIR